MTESADQLIVDLLVRLIASLHLTETEWEILLERIAERHLWQKLCERGYVISRQVKEYE